MVSKMEITSAKQYATELLKVYCPEFKVKFNNMISCFAYCDFSKNEIVVSRYYTKMNDFETFKKVILHEIAHIITPSIYHTKTFKKTARKLGGEENKEVVAKTEPYSKFYCEVCGSIEEIPKRFKNVVCSYCYDICNKTCKMKRCKNG